MLRHHTSIRHCKHDPLTPSILHEQNDLRRFVNVEIRALSWTIRRIDPFYRLLQLLSGHTWMNPRIKPMKRGEPGITPIIGDTAQEKLRVCSIERSQVGAPAKKHCGSTCGSNCLGGAICAHGC